MAPTELSPSQQALLYFVSSGQPFIARTKLVKLIYMADLEAVRFLGEPISDLRWQKRYYGPFDPAFYDIQDSLEPDHLRVIAHPMADGNEWYSYEIPAPVPDFTLPAEKLKILRDVFRAFGGMKTEVFVREVVYKTRPFLEVAGAPEKARIPLEIVHGDDGLDPERIEAGRERIRSGQGVPLSTALDAIRGRS